MGGCKCSYRNCTVKTDGKTHLFHFPVFDKVRCQQWLINAQRMNFLDLKVSQLKNRVICQHHFKDDAFMNIKKDKLKNSAVPTENGPFCTSSSPDEENLSERLLLYNDEPQIIETNAFEKKASFLVKYSDFLSSSGLFELDDLNEKIIKNEKDKSVGVQNNRFRANFKSAVREHEESKNTNTVVQDSIQVYAESKQKPEDVSQASFLLEPKDLDVEFEPLKPKIEIVNEERVNKILNLQSMGQVMHVTPSFILRPKNNRNTNANPTPHVINTQMKDHVPTPEVNENSKKPIQSNREILNTTITTRKKEMIPHQNPNVIVRPPETSLIKPGVVRGKVMRPLQISPEKMEVINQKRKFNMRLKDLVAQELNKLDDEEVVSENKPQKEQQPTMDALNARMNKLETMLLNKVDRNTECIMEMKNMLHMHLSSESNPAVRSVGTQSRWPIEEHKKFLFCSISEYLSSELMNSLYEELFINNIPPVTQMQDRRPKRRKMN